MKMKYAVFILLGIVIGLYLGDFLTKDQEPPRVVTKLEFKSDTVYIRKLDTVYIVKTDIEQVVVRDTILTEYAPNIKAYKALFPLVNGNISVSGEVLGEVLKMNVVSDIKSPLVTNTIKETVTITKKPAGLFVTAGIAKGDSQLSPYVGAIFIKDRYLIGVNTKSIQLGYRIR